MKRRRGYNVILSHAGRALGQPAPDHLQRVLPDAITQMSDGIKTKHVESVFVLGTRGNLFIRRDKVISVQS